MYLSHLSGTDTQHETLINLSIFILVMLEISARNRKVALHRWHKVLESKTTEIKSATRKYRSLKALIVGYLMGDGCVTVRKDSRDTVHHVILFYPDDKKMLIAFLSAFERVYKHSSKPKRLPGYFKVAVYSKPIVIDLLKLGPFRSLEWSVPKMLLTTKKSKIAWLRAFYDCEAYVGPKIITVQSVNKQGLEQVQILLKEFNITSRLYSYKRKQLTWNTNFLLCIIKKVDRAKFLRHIGFNHTKKQAKLQKYAGVA